MNKNVDTFGSYIRNQRISKKISQRELAKQLGISAPYLNDIEKNKRFAPRTEIISVISHILEADLEILHDLAAKSKNTIPVDIEHLLIEKPEVVSLLRSINFHNLTKKKVLAIKETIESNNTGVIIIAAGLGSRLKNYTEKKPKCMLEFGSETLLERQINAYKANGINKISVIRGYKKEIINYPDLTYYENPEYEHNNSLNSLFYAEEALCGQVIISYSDILFEKEVVERLMQSEHDISIVVDIDWQGNYFNRISHPVEQAEKVIFDANNNVIEIGKIITKKHDVHGEFIGMMKFSPRGAEIFKKHFHRSKIICGNKQFQTSKSFKRAYLTDLIQEMSDLGVLIHCVIIERGWKEIDTVEDYEKALKDFI